MTTTGGNVSADTAQSSVSITMSTFAKTWYLYAIIFMLTILSFKVTVSTSSE
jgi:hypothetical protein